MDLTAIVDVLSEAGDPHTPSSRLEELAQHAEPLVRQMARRNASLTETAHQRYILEGDPDAWASPLVTFLLLMLVGDASVYGGARRCAIHLAQERRVDLEPELRQAVVPVIESWWREGSKAMEMLRYTADLALAQGVDGPTHRTLVRIASVYVAMVADMGGEWKADIDQAVELINAWLNQHRINHASESERLFARFVDASSTPGNTSAAYALRTAQQAILLTDRGFNIPTVEATAQHAADAYKSVMGADAMNAKEAFEAEVALAVRKAVERPPLPPALGGGGEPPPPSYTPTSSPARTKRAPAKKSRR